MNCCKAGDVIRAFKEDEEVNASTLCANVAGVLELLATMSGESTLNGHSGCR